MKRRLSSSLLSIFGISGLLALPAVAQKIFLKDGKELQWADCTVTGANIAWKTVDALNNPRILNYPATEVVRIDYPEPQELQEAYAATLRGEGDTALSKSEEVIKLFGGFKTTAGSWYVPASLVKLEALAIKKSNDEFDKLNAELKNMTLSSGDQIRLTAAQAAQDYYKGATGPAKQAIEKLLPSSLDSSAKTDDAGVLAKLYLLLGDIEFKRQAFAEAREAYLHVPVFYGSQAPLLPAAELGAARSLVKLQRLEDAAQMMAGIKERYPGTPQAKAAEEEYKLLIKAGVEMTEAKEKEKDKDKDKDAKPADGAKPEEKKAEEKKPEEKKPEDAEKKSEDKK